MATKIIKFNNGTYTYVPVTLASAVQYRYGKNSVTSVQEVIGLTAGSVLNHINSYGDNTTYGHVKVDSALNASSTNPVQNKAINTALSGKADSGHTHDISYNGTNATITAGGSTSTAIKASATTYGFTKVETSAVQNSTNAISSGALYTHSDTKASTSAYGHVIVDGSLNLTSTNPVQNKVINTALSGKANSTHSHVITWSGSNYSPNDSVSTVNVLTYFNDSSTTLNNNGTTSYTTVTVPTTHYVDSKIGDIGSALNFKGTVGPNETRTALPTSGVKVGDVWLVKLASGTNSTILSGQTLENGDMIIATNSSPVAWTVVNANWTATDGYQNVTVGASSPTTLATIGGVAIDIKVAQEANVVYKSDLTSYVNGLNTATGTGVVTGAKLETNGGGQKLTLSYTDLSHTISGGTGRSVISEIKQNSQGKISVVTTDIATMKAATGSNDGLDGFVPAPTAGSQNKVLTGAAVFKTISASQGNHATGLLYKTMDTTEEFILFDDTKFTGSPVSLATIASPAITVSLS